MASSISTKPSSPITSNNSLKDVVDWIKNGDCVVLHTDEMSRDCTRVFHNCLAKADMTPDYLEKTRVIYVDLSSDKTLLKDDEWPWYISQADCRRCTCEVADRVFNKEKSIPHAYFFAFNPRL